MKYIRTRAPVQYTYPDGSTGDVWPPPDTEEGEPPEEGLKDDRRAASSRWRTAPGGGRF